MLYSPAGNISFRIPAVVRRIRAGAATVSKVTASRRYAAHLSGASRPFPVGRVKQTTSSIADETDAWNENVPKEKPTEEDVADSIRSFRVAEADS